jgi:hypothetical protein
MKNMHLCNYADYLSCNSIFEMKIKPKDINMIRLSDKGNGFICIEETSLIIICGTYYPFV